MNGVVVVDGVEIAAFVQEMHSTAPAKRRLMIEQAVEDFLVWRFKKKGPASAATDPDRVSRNPLEGSSNVSSNTTAPADPARTEESISAESLIYDIHTSLEDAIERLLVLLDQLDGDPDFEEQHDAEPEETDQNGDELDFCRSEDDALLPDLFNVPFGPLAGGQGL